MIFSRFQEAMNKPTHAVLRHLPTYTLFIEIDHLRIVRTLGPAKVNRQANILSIRCASTSLRLNSCRNSRLSANHPR
jgi:hypothetical protein